ncbi:MAG: type II secretion system minor pseudopilin GspI [Steroidobacteraceae bacterium]
MNTPAAERTHRGFTLIEVLAALVIVALGMLGVIEAVTQTARNGTYLREKTLAHWIAMNLVTERRLLGSPPEVGVTSDELEYAGQRWRYTVTVTQTQVESLRRMDVSVRAAEAPEDSALATVAGFYGTAIGAAGGGSLDWSGADTAGGPAGDDGGDDEADAGGDGPPAPIPDPSPDPSEEDE